MTVKETELILKNIDWFYFGTIAIYSKDVAIYEDDWCILLKQEDMNI